MGASAALNGQIALVTGAGRGIGAATARLLARAGTRVALLSRSRSDLEAVAASIRLEERAAEVLVLIADVQRSADVAAAFALIDAEWGALNILVNNAGTLSRVRIEDLHEQEWDRTLNVNLKGSYLCAREAFVRMQKNGGGSIVNMSSLAGIRGSQKFPGCAAYVAAKHGVIGLTEALAVEGRPHGIRVNCLAPGAVRTDMLRQADPHLQSDTSAEQIAEQLVYLCDAGRSAVLSGSILEVHSNV